MGLSEKKGWKKTSKSGREVFEEFFSNSTDLKDFIGYGGDFYSNVRCGLLHQAEITGGWHIIRKNKLFDKKQ